MRRVGSPPPWPGVVVRPRPPTPRRAPCAPGPRGVTALLRRRRGRGSSRYTRSGRGGGPAGGADLRPDPASRPRTRRVRRAVPVGPASPTPASSLPSTPSLSLPLSLCPSLLLRLSVFTLSPPSLYLFPVSISFLSIRLSLSVCPFSLCLSLYPSSVQHSPVFSFAFLSSLSLSLVPLSVFYFITAVISVSVYSLYLSLSLPLYPRFSVLGPVSGVPTGGFRGEGPVWKEPQNVP